MPPKKKRKSLNQWMDKLVWLHRTLPEGVNITQTDYYREFLREVMFFTFTGKDDHAIKTKLDTFLVKRPSSGEIATFIESLGVNRPGKLLVKPADSGPAPRTTLLSRMVKGKKKGKRKI